MDRRRASGRGILLFAGRYDDALVVERTLRARYDGGHRSPWNEIECGNHYARSLASWALLLGATGAQWDAPTGVLSFAPCASTSSATQGGGSATQGGGSGTQGTERFLFTTGTGWGRVEIDRDALTLHLDGGALDIADLQLHGRSLGRGIRLRASESQRFPLTTTPTPEAS